MVKKHSVSDTARTASLADLRRWPGDGVFGMKPNSGSDALPASGGFFGQNRKLQRSRKTDLGVERSRNPDLGKKNPDLGAGLAGCRLCRAGAAGLCRAAGASQPFAKKKRAAVLPHGRTGIFVTLVAPMSRKRGWASPFWASPYSLGEPSNEVGASHQTRLGRAIKRGWASQY